MIEKMKEILRKWFGKKKESVNETKYATMLEATNEKGKQSSMLQRLEGYLFGRYDFRFNVLTEQPEYREKGTSNFIHVDQRMLTIFFISSRYVATPLPDVP